ncbi:hypothetical protein HDU77_010189 [Chytriomyces hyalinus]|nr:hypothetical protein HDU77_010189 [Chytriomyces hyalinus]KAJ3406379.1 hypothetical protein HDU80_011391 [Chytriomyces hyalinus]
MTPTHSQTLSLYRSLLRSSRIFTNYNFRSYVYRRSRDAFRENRGETSADVVARLYAKGVQELAVAQRQGTIDRMFRPKSGLVVEYPVTR